MRYLSVCSGIEAASVAWEPLGWTPAAFCEIEAFPSAVLDDGGAFGSFLGVLGELGYGWAYRVLDAQYVRVDGYPRAVPQRRRRVFVVACAGGCAGRAGAVLFEPEGVRRDSPPRRETGEGASSDASGGFEVCGTLSDGADHGGGLNGQDAYTGRILPVAFDARQTDVCVYGDKTGPPDTDGSSIGVCVTGDRTHALRAEGADAGEDGTGLGTPIVPSGMSVRRLTPVECERLQGFPDNHTRIPWKGKPVSDCPDGPRYRALGNSMAVNVMRWIGRRIELVDAL